MNDQNEENKKNEKIKQNEAPPKITAVEKTVKEKDRRKVELGKGLAKISKEAKE